MALPESDPLVRKNGGSPMKSLSWSEQTVNHVDDRCVQMAIGEMKRRIPGKDIDDKQWKKLRPRSFRGIDIKNLLDNSESRKYVPLALGTLSIPPSLQCDIFNAVEELAGSRYRWKIVADHAESAEVDHRPDLARYPLDIPAASAMYTHKVGKDDPNIARCAWAWMSSLVEVKNSDENSAFHFLPSKDQAGEQKFLRDSDVGRKTRAQFIKYAIEGMLRQHRTHFYTFYFSGMYARVFRWDRVGCIASEPIDLEKNAKQFLNILYRLATSTDDYGSDNTVQLASQKDISLVEAYDPEGNEYLQEYKDMMLKDRLYYPIYKVSLPAVFIGGEKTHDDGERCYLIGRYAFGHYSPVGRCTRGYAAFDLQTKRLAWLKDQWRCIARPHTELDAYIRLHKHGVSYIATPIAGGDIDEHRTVSQGYMTHLSADWRPSERVHTRLVTKEVGRVLESYADSAELLRVCGEAFIETRKGFLNDWDLCKYREDMDSMVPASEPSGISGTWAFKSALSLRYPRKPPSLADDLEAFVHVILWFACRFHLHDHSPDPEDSSKAACIKANVDNPALLSMVYVFFYFQKRVGGGYYKGGAAKYKAILRGEPPITFEALEDGRLPLLGKFLLHAYKLLSEHYWAMDQAEMEQWDVRPGDRVSPDEIEVVRPAPVAVRAASSEDEDEDEELESYLDAYVEQYDDDEFELELEAEIAQAKKMNCPFRNPRRVLEGHAALGTLFIRMFREKGGEKVDLRGLRDDKRFDQFLSWKMLCFLNQPGPTGKPLKLALMKSSAEKDKRKRSAEDSPEDELPRKRNRATIANEVAKTQTPPPWKRSRPGSRKLTAKPQPKNTGKAAVRKAETTRRHRSPRDVAAMKAETAGRPRPFSTAKVVEPSLPLRRSTRLAAKDKDRQGPP
ncbi:uncharacterized protein PHACADRAFT_119131 [Phanerochaete carnosa HHB-10118-sp]|uniref:Fungal-type protein kinase domain-containing protein n=1 Tax=Phanerochaete carnosa (strain HHB-10118-sp) TaxID=650164 RepID=K5V352_PHACS|nr:uncharacterized protein PHACADRAFT_119131 [Phanerochaete carnosa HHB-10118-sp]EKM56996.1 hypothetical protein PHACADRAFT_119131 [Phanerochaete carnosa HHB-10118-sp]